MKTLHFTTSPARSPATRVRLTYLDGLRGLAAAYVVLFHASQLCQLYAVGRGMNPHASKLIQVSHFLFTGYGRYAVDVFIVLSGYCLMLPIARAGSDTIVGGVWSFLKRRAWRILPPYYAALALSLVMIFLVHGMSTRDGSYWDSALATAGGVSISAIVSHLLLVHSLTSNSLKIDAPMWSVAVEWQIYFLFPLLILPLRKFVGSIPTVAICFVGGVVGTVLLSRHLHDPHVYGWFTGLFAMGAMGACINFETVGRDAGLRRFDLRPLILVCVGLVIALTLAERGRWQNLPILRWRQNEWFIDWPIDLLIGIATSALIVHVTGRILARSQAVELRPPGFLLSIFESRPARLLGDYSYSLYLIHAPILSLIDFTCRRAGCSALTICAFTLLISLPVSFVAAYGFHLVFEKPFTVAKKKTQPPVVVPLAEAVLAV